MFGTFSFYSYKIKAIRYLYVPFPQHEISDQFLAQIKRFRDSGVLAGRPLIILYHGQCNAAFLPPGAVIYVVGHGIDVSPNTKPEDLFLDPCRPSNIYSFDWPYAISSGISYISIDEVARRFKSDFLSQLDNVDVVKLWFCDPNHKANKARIMANKFADHFKDHNRLIRIDYYPAIITNYGFYNGEAHKIATDNASYLSRSIKAIKVTEVTKAKSIRGLLYAGTDYSLSDASAGTKKLAK